MTPTDGCPRCGAVFPPGTGAEPCLGCLLQLGLESGVVAGAHLGPYEIVAPIGAGGMGDVYRARDERLKREVAIKVLPGAASTEPDRLRRFEQEAQSASALNHPNIMAVYDVGSHDGVPYIVTELLEGQTLRERLVAGPLPPRKAAEYAAQIARGLSAAHAKGIVHRDLKPENVFLTAEDHVKILDFGLAKLTAASIGAGTTGPVAEDATDPGTVLGTLAYMSPEQLKGGEVDARSDIFAFGAVLSEMLSGRGAFQRDSAAETASAILKEQPAGLSEAGTDIPPGLTHIVRHCLEKEPDARLQSIRDVALKLSDPSTIPEPDEGRPRRLSAVVGASLILLAAFGIWWSRPVPPRPSAGRPMLAVLPFQNLTGDPGQDYLSDGLTDELISRLGSLDPQGLGVIARTSVMHYRNAHTGLDQIGRELGVQYVLEGTLRRDEGRVRVSAQLIQLSDQTHMWARQYDREPISLLTLQTEIAHAVADEIQLTLGGRRSSRPSRPVPPPVSDEAYDLYLRGQYFWNMRTTQGLRQAIDYFGRAIALDPEFARAHAGLASSYALLGGYSGEPQIEFMSKARAASLRALELDPSLAEAEVALALIVQNFDWDWRGAEKRFLRAIESNPNYATAHHWYAEHLTLRGRFEEALAEASRAQHLDPFSLIISADKAMIFYYSRQYERAIASLNAVLAMDPGLARTHMVRYAYVETGRFEEALADIESYRSVESSPWHWSSLAYVYGRAGRRRESEHALAQLLEVNRLQATDPATISWAYLGLGEKEEAVVWLERAYAQHSNVLATLGVEPGYDPLRGDPRFQALMRRVGLAE